MKKVASVVLVAIAVLFISTAAFGDNKAYLAGFVGGVLPEDSNTTVTASGVQSSGEITWDPGLSFSVAIGFNSDNTRYEGEYAYFRIEGKDSDSALVLNTLLFNFYYDFKIKGPISPYLSAGIGLGNAGVDNADLSGSDAFTLFQVGTGVSYEIVEDLFLDFKYRYHRTADIHFEEDSNELDIVSSGHSLLVGIRKYFK